jgi:hypothetical protein
MTRLTNLIIDFQSKRLTPGVLSIERHDKFLPLEFVFQYDCLASSRTGSQTYTTHPHLSSIQGNAFEWPKWQQVEDRSSVQNLLLKIELQFQTYVSLVDITTSYRTVGLRKGPATVSLSPEHSSYW